MQKVGLFLESGKQSTVFDQPIGRVLERGAAIRRPGDTARIILRRGSKLGYFLRTASCSDR
jgi:hypothetical protein